MTHTITSSSLVQPLPVVSGESLLGNERSTEINEVRDQATILATRPSVSPTRDYCALSTLKEATNTF